MSSDQRISLRDYSCKIISLKKFLSFSYIYTYLECNKQRNEEISYDRHFLHFERGPGVQLSNFDWCPRAPLLNFRGVLSPTFKLWEGSRVSSTRVRRFHILESWFHFYIMPIYSVRRYGVFFQDFLFCLYSKGWQDISQILIVYNHSPERTLDKKFDIWFYNLLWRK